MFIVVYMKRLLNQFCGKFVIFTSRFLILLWMQILSKEVHGFACFF